MTTNEPSRCRRLRHLTATLASAVFLLGFPLLLHSQEIRSDKCDTPKEPVGRFDGMGSVRYRLDTNPDTATVVVLTVAQSSVAGFRSAAVRKLSACRMHRPAQSLLVVQEMRFDSVAAALPTAIPATGDEWPLALEPAQPLAAGTIFAGNDRVLEERPRWANCDRAPHTRIVTTSEISPLAEGSAGDPADHGLVTATLVIGTDGRVMKDSVTLVRSDNPLATSKLMRSLASCRFAPGRIAGVPVPTRIEATMSVSPRGYSVFENPGRSVLMTQ